MKLWKWSQWGRGGELSGLFVALPEHVEKMNGRTVHFGEVLGKHSDVEVTFDPGDIEAVSREVERREAKGQAIPQADGVACELSPWECAQSGGHQSHGLWRCEGCGDAYDFETDRGAWRWTGLIYEHKCPGLEPQAGHMPARFFGTAAVSQPDGYADAGEKE